MIGQHERRMEAMLQRESLEEFFHLIIAKDMGGRLGLFCGRHAHKLGWIMVDKAAGRAGIR